MKHLPPLCRRLLSTLFISLIATAAHAVPITYLDLDFEDGTPGSGRAATTVAHAIISLTGNR